MIDDQNDPVLMIRVGQQMLDLDTWYDQLAEQVWWDEPNEEWRSDSSIGYGFRIADALNRLKYQPKPEDFLP